MAASRTSKAAPAAATPPASAPPPPYITVEIDGAERTIKMSFGLLNELTELVKGPDMVPMLHFHSETSATALSMLLAKRDKQGRMTNTDDDPAVPFDLDPAIAEELLDWVAVHCLDFFIRRFAKSAHLLDLKSKDLQATGSSLISSAN